MVEIPKDLDEAIAQAKEATKAAISDGCRRLQVEIVIPEIKAQPLAEKFIPALAEDFGERFKVYFPDAGAAALARRDWGETPYVVRGMSELKGEMQPDDEAFLFIEPSSIEINQLEQMCQEAGDRTVVLLLPRMENVAVTGIGVAGRNLRERFLNSIESCYYIRPLDGATLFRCYPSPWQIWLEAGDTHQLISETSEKPVGDALELILAKATGTGDSQQQPQPKRQDFLSKLKSFLRALKQ